MGKKGKTYMNNLKSIIELVSLIAVFFWVGYSGFTIITLASGIIVSGVVLSLIDVIFGYINLNRR